MSGERQDLEWLVEGTLGLGRLDKHSTAADLQHVLEEFGAAAAPPTDLQRGPVRRLAVDVLTHSRVRAPAVGLSRKACEGGAMQGCGHLAVMYENGAGVAPDLERAVSLYQQACDGGVVGACRAVESLPGARN